MPFRPGRCFRRPDPLRRRAQAHRRLAAGDAPAAGPIVAELAQALEHAGQPAVFLVRDNGPGIPSEHHQRVFGLFGKLDPRSESTGVGRALVKRIVEVHGGRIWVESDGPGRGSTFFFTLGATPQP